jgi:hypothetical protein
MAENEKQLNVWLPEELRTYIAQRAKQEKRGRNQIIADLIRQDMAQRSGQFVEHNSLMVMREMVAAELRQAHAQLRHDLREDREHEEESRREWVRKQVDRLAGLMVMAIRNSGIGRRLSYALLSKAHGAEFAKAIYDDARIKANRELLPKKAPNEHVHHEDDEQVS